MCGIMGYVGPRDAWPIVMSGLKRLEYRGYDSAGVATIHRSRLKLAKQVGHLSALDHACPGGLPKVPYSTLRGQMVTSFFSGFQVSDVQPRKGIEHLKNLKHLNSSYSSVSSF